MSLNSQSLLRFKQKITPTVRLAFLMWGVLGIGGYMLMSINSTNTTVLRDDINKTRESLNDLRADHESGDPEMLSELDRARQELSVVTDRITHMESALGGQSRISDLSNLAQSEQAVLKANTAKHSATANAAVRDLGKLKDLQMEWAVLDAALMNGPAGHRIAGSAKHFPLVVDLWQSERPTAEQIVDWERELDPLTEPLLQAAADSTTIAITEEHAKRLSDLGKELKTQAAEFERHKLLLESILRETSALPAGTNTFAAALERRSTQSRQAEVDRLAAVRATARAAAEKEQADQIARAERQLADEKSKQLLEKIASERQLQADAAHVEELQRKAKMEGLREDSKRIQDAVQETLLDAQLQRDMNEIRGLLAAFVSPGFKHRNDDKKGPASLSVIKERKALEDTQTGMTGLLWLACADNDRPRGGLPYYIGGYVNWNETNAKPIERAQELLNKYGELMVKKGLLAE